MTPMFTLISITFVSGDPYHKDTITRTLHGHENMRITQASSIRIQSQTSLQNKGGSPKGNGRPNHDVGDRTGARVTRVGIFHQKITIGLVAQFYQGRVKEGEVRKLTPHLETRFLWPRYQIVLLLTDCAANVDRQFLDVIREILMMSFGMSVWRGLSEECHECDRVTTPYTRHWHYKTEQLKNITQSACPHWISRAPNKVSQVSKSCCEKTRVRPRLINLTFDAKLQEEGLARNRREHLLSL